MVCGAKDAREARSMANCFYRLWSALVPLSSQCPSIKGPHAWKIFCAGLMQSGLLKLDKLKPHWKRNARLEHVEACDWGSSRRSLGAQNVSTERVQEVVRASSYGFMYSGIDLQILHFFFHHFKGGDVFIRFLRGALSLWAVLKPVNWRSATTKDPR